MSRNDSCFSKNHWWVLIIILLFSIISLELLSILSENWFFRSMKSYEWHGGLLYPNSNFGNYSTSQSYLDIWNDCDKSGASSPLSSDECSMFKSLYIGGIIYVTLESLSIMLALVTTIFLIIDIFHNIKRLWISIPLFWIMFATHLIGFWIWSGYSSLFYSSDCEDNDWKANDISSNVCAEEGAIASLVCVLWIPLVGSIQLIAYYSLKLKVRFRERTTAILDNIKVDKENRIESQNNDEHCMNKSFGIGANTGKDDIDLNELFPIQEERTDNIAKVN